MQHNKVAILGGGISGLAAAFYLTQRCPEAECTLFEASGALGGVMAAPESGRYFFESGPRTFSTSSTPTLWALIEQLGLQDKRRFSHAQRRYLYAKGQLRMLPSNPFRALLSPYGKDLALGAARDLLHPKGDRGDESIEAFIVRHFNKGVARRLVDPFVLGIYAGDSAQLSVSACFPKWKEYERRFGSLIKGVYASAHAGDTPPLYTLEGGMHLLPKALARQSACTIRYNTPITSLEEEEGAVRVNGEAFAQVIAALPAHSLQRLLRSARFASFFEGLPRLTLSTVALAYQGERLPPKAFGYLIPSDEQEEVLGVLFDSELFPLDTDEGACRVSVFVRGSGARERAERAVARHLGFRSAPVFCREQSYVDILPQYPVGHLDRLSLLQSNRIRFAGNYLQGVSVEACLISAQRAAEQVGDYLRSF